MTTTHWPNCPELDAAMAPLFAVRPWDEGLATLVVGGLQSLSLNDPALVAASEVVTTLANRPAIIPGIWLWVGDLDRAHRICQDQITSEGSLWHAIVHRLEGDFFNSRYWLHKVHRLDRGEDLLEAVEKAQGAPTEPLVSLQRQQWADLMEHCYLLNGSRK